MSWSYFIFRAAMPHARVDSAAFALVVSATLALSGPHASGQHIGSIEPLDEFIEKEIISSSDASSARITGLRSMDLPTGEIFVTGTVSLRFGETRIERPFSATIQFDVRGLTVITVKILGALPASSSAPPSPVAAFSTAALAEVPVDASGSGTSVSGDGNTIVGYLNNGFSTPFHAFVWMEETDVIDLGTLDPTNNDTLLSFARNVSDNGSVVVGMSQLTGGTVTHAFRWTETGGMIDLGSGVGPAGFSAAFGVSGDGSVVVGQSTFPPTAGLFTNTNQAFRWTGADGFQTLGTINGIPNSIALAVTSDASVIVGRAILSIPSGASSISRARAFRWTEAGGMENLGVLPGDEYSTAVAVSDDGTIVIGISSTALIDNLDVGQGLRYDNEKSRAFYWTEATGIQDLTALLSDAGIDMTDTPLHAVTGMSSDGTWISAVTNRPDPDPNFPGRLIEVSVLASLTYTPPPPPDLVNVSTRAMSLGGDAAIIPGVVISGTGTKRVLIRAVGPKLQDLGVNEFMPDPGLSVYRQGEDTPLATNDDWTAQEAGRPDPADVGGPLGAFALTPSMNAPTDDTLSAALVLDLPAGGYTAVARDAQDRPGVALVEVYDAGEAAGTARFVNVSNRGFVGNGEAVTIPGFVVDGDAPQRYLIRAVGPKLGDFGLAADSLLADPRLSVYRQGEATPLASNDDWAQPTEGTADDVKAVMQQVGAFSLEATMDHPTNDAQSAALVIVLDPGIYTVVVSGANDGTGIALAEVYEAPP